MQARELSVEEMFANGAFFVSLFVESNRAASEKDADRLLRAQFGAQGLLLYRFARDPNWYTSFVHPVITDRINTSRENLLRLTRIEADDLDDGDFPF
jgi:hypothetical protein